MRRRSSKKHEERMELDKLSSSNLEDPPISGAYIRSLVKQLNTSTTTNESMNSKDQDCFVARKHGKAHQSTQQQPQQQHKKQVRRRLHTSRPYQERLLNMAEARKEIVTALKFHRAAMKQARERQQQQQQQPPPPQVQEQHQQSFEQDGRFKGRRNPRIYPSCRANFPNKMEDFSCSYLSQPLPPPPTLAPNSYTWANAPSLITQPPQTLLAENPNFVLPSQTLGLNLNFHDFNNLDATLQLNNSSLSSYSSPTSSPPLSVVTDQEAHSVGMSQGQGDGSSSLVDTIQSGATTRTSGSGDLHTAMDDEGMAEIRSLGEQYQMEWSDTMNLVKSACWFKYLRNIEHEVPGVKIGDGSYHFFDEVVEFPAWLNANGSCLEKCSDDYFQDSALPCMDIGDIESMDGDWLA